MSIFSAQFVVDPAAFFDGFGGFAARAGRFGQMLVVEAGKRSGQFGDFVELIGGIPFVNQNAHLLVILDALHQFVETQTAAAFRVLVTIGP